MPTMRALSGGECQAGSGRGLAGAARASSNGNGTNSVGEAERVRALEQQYVLGTYKRAEPVFVRGSGCTLIDVDGVEYLDFTAGIAVNCLGHADGGWVDAIASQAKSLGHVSNLFHSQPHAELASELVTSTSFAGKVYFSNSGAEANEAAMKFARKHFPGKTKTLTFSNGFHGRTMGSLSLTPKQGIRQPFEPLVPGTETVEYGDLEAAEQVLSSGDVGAVFVEPIQGEGGVMPAPSGFLAWLKNLCEQYGALLVFDEVQSGLGRCGTLFAHEIQNVSPDMLTLAKPLAAGLPIGATLLTDEVAESIEPGDHGSTFAGSPIVCNAALYTLRMLKSPGFLEGVQERANQLHTQLEDKLQGIAGVEGMRGKGLLVGVKLDSASAGSIVAKARERGLLVLAAGDGDVLRLAPPLVISEAEVQKGVDVLASAMEEVLGKKEGYHEEEAVVAAA